MKKLLLLVTLVLSSALASCAGEDPVTPDPNAGKRTYISAFYAHPDQTLPVYVKVGDSVTIRALEYGQFASGLAPYGDRPVTFQAQSGTELITSGNVNIQPDRSAWAIYAGTGLNQEVITSSIAKGTLPSAPFAGVRFIHASKNAGKVKVRLDATSGPALTQDFVDYGKSSDAFTTINVSTTALVMVNEAGNAIYTLPLTGLAALLPGKLYTVVLYGNADVNAVNNKLAARVLLEPGQ
jgi:hypothetical protein